MNTQRSRRPRLNRKRIVWPLLLLLFVLLYTCYKQRTAPALPGASGYKTDAATAKGLQIPAPTPSGQVIGRRGYTLSFNAKHQQAAWVGYVLRGYQVRQANENRSDAFLVDPLAKPHSADEADYNNSGYDRGHLAAAEDMGWSAQTMRESFYYSNVSPQVPAFNRGVWKRLEELVRYWAEAYDSVYVITGPVLRPGLPVIGHDAVSVPKQFYKVVLEYNRKGVQGIGFLLRNEASAAPLKSFAVSVDEVEKLTGLDFFPQLPDDVEQKIESSANTAGWLWEKRRN